MVSQVLHCSYVLSIMHCCSKSEGAPEAPRIAENPPNVHSKRIASDIPKHENLLFYQISIKDWLFNFQVIMIWLGGGYFFHDFALCCHSLPQRSTGIGWAIQNEKREAQPMSHVWSRIKFDLPQFFHHLHLCGRWTFGVNWRKVSQQNRPVWLTTSPSASCLKFHRETHVKTIPVNLKFRIAPFPISQVAVDYMGFDSNE